MSESPVNGPKQFARSEMGDLVVESQVWLQAQLPDTLQGERRLYFLQAVLPLTKNSNIPRC